jgi:hypothetical protein
LLPWQLRQSLFNRFRFCWFISFLFREKFVRHISRRCLDQTLWNLVGISYAMWSCAFKGWFFQNGCRCHGNGQIIIIITRFDCVWMQTQKAPNDPISEFGHVDARVITTKQFLTSKYSKISIVHWNRRPLTIYRFCRRPFWKRWHRKNLT